jgi:hypothetical protein
MLDASKPAVNTFLSDYGSIIRETREYCNTLAVTSGTDITTYSASTTSLAVGVELSAAPVEVIMLSGTAALTTITDGTNGMLKIINFRSATLSVVNDAIGTVGGVFRLNAFEDFDASVGDVLVFINVGGVAGISDGYWQESMRTVAVV